MLPYSTAVRLIALINTFKRNNTFITGALWFGQEPASGVAAHHRNSPTRVNFVANVNTAMMAQRYIFRCFHVIFMSGRQIIRPHTWMPALLMSRSIVSTPLTYSKIQ